MSRRNCIRPAKQLRVTVEPLVLMRFLKMVHEEDRGSRLGPCWIWQGCTDDAGYGQFSLYGKSQWAHRVSYAIFRCTIPATMEIDHKCRVKSCVNPRHLMKKPCGKHRSQSAKQKKIPDSELPPF